MFRTALFLFTITILLSGCAPEDKIAPSTVWSAGCGELGPSKGAYQFLGMCCEYVDLPNLTFLQGKTITVNGTYHSFTGAGFTNEPVKIVIIVSEDGQKMKMSFLVYGVLRDFDLVPGKAKIACDCLCD